MIYKLQDMCENYISGTLQTLLTVYQFIKQFNSIFDVRYNTIRHFTHLFRNYHHGIHLDKYMCIPCFDPYMFLHSDMDHSRIRQPL